MVNKTDYIILELIKKSLFYGYQVDFSIFRDANWGEVIDLATTQGVLGICSDVIELLPAECRPDLENLMEWMGLTSILEYSYEEHKKALARLASFYDGNGIRMMLLKGYGLSLYWPKPQHRPVGDIDIYLWNLWGFADQMVSQELGIKVDDGHEHHTTFEFQGITIENHYDFINTQAHKDAPRIEEKLKALADKGGKNVKIGEEGKECDVCFPSADFNVIFLIRHLGQHFAGERITLRQLLDWGLFLQYEGSNVNWTEVIPFLKEMGIWTFFNHINAICVDTLGLECIERFDWFERTTINKDLESRILEDMLHPEFDEEKPQNLLPIILFKTKRWWYNRWKHPLVYKEWLLPMFFTLLWSHIRRIKTIKDG